MDDLEYVFADIRHVKVLEKYNRSFSCSCETPGHFA
jgi:hypothetical protein